MQRLYCVAKVLITLQRDKEKMRKIEKTPHAGEKSCHTDVKTKLVTGAKTKLERETRRLNLKQRHENQC